MALSHVLMLLSHGSDAIAGQSPPAASGYAGERIVSETGPVTCSRRAPSHVSRLGTWLLLDPGNKNQGPMYFVQRPMKSLLAEDRWKFLVDHATSRTALRSRVSV